MEIKISKEMWIEDLLDKYPEAQRFLSKQKIVCIACGEPVWGSLEEVIKRAGRDTDEVIGELIKFLKKDNNS